MIDDQGNKSATFRMQRNYKNWDSFQSTSPNVNGVAENEMTTHLLALSDLVSKSRREADAGKPIACKRENEFSVDDSQEGNKRRSSSLSADCLVLPLPPLVTRCVAMMS